MEKRSIAANSQPISRSTAIPVDLPWTLVHEGAAKTRRPTQLTCKFMGSSGCCVVLKITSWDEGKRQRMPDVPIRLQSFAWSTQVNQTSYHLPGNSSNASCRLILKPCNNQWEMCYYYYCSDLMYVETRAENQRNLRYRVSKCPAQVQTQEV